MSLLRPVAHGNVTQPFAGSFSGERPGYIRTDLRVDRGRRTSFYGARFKLDFHGGIDYGCQSGTPVLAAHDGVIVDQGRYDYTGEYFVILRVKRTLRYQLVVEYTHLQAGTFRHRVGEYVKRGMVLALSGNTGWSSGPHLHFELRRGLRWETPSFLNSYRWMKFDPQPFIDGLALTAIT